MPAIPGLRSPYVKVGRLVYFGRMLDKIRLHAAGKLPPGYVANLGDTQPFWFDARFDRFLGIRYEDLKEHVLAGGSTKAVGLVADEEILAWTEARGTRRSDDDCIVWNRFMAKLGWRDDRSAKLRERVVEFGLTGRTIETIFDLIDYDEGRDPVAERAWEKI